MRIQHNIMAMNAYRNYNNNIGSLSKNLEKLSSGYRINRAGDDAAGLAISEKMRAQISGLDAAQKNVKDGISLVKTAEGALQEVQDMMNRMKYLAVQSANGTYDNEVDRDNLQKEVDALKTEINRIADSANFNGQKLLNGELAAEASTAVSPEANSDAPMAIGQPTGTDLTTTINEATKHSFETGAVTAATAAGKVSITYMDTDGSSKTVDLDIANGDDASDIVSAINSHADLKKLFKATATGGSSNQVKIEALNAGSDAAHVTAVDKADGGSLAIAAGTGATAGEDRTMTLDFDDNDKSTVTVNGKTYEILTDTSEVQEGNIAVAKGANEAGTAANLVAALKANGVTSAVASGNDVKIGDLSEIQSAQQGNVTVATESDGVILQNTADVKGVYTFTGPTASTVGSHTFTIEYLDESGTLQTKDISYEVETGKTGPVDVGATLATALKDAGLDQVFDIEASEADGEITMTAKNAGTDGARVLSIESTDTGFTGAGSVALATETEAKDAGLDITIKNGTLKAGDTVEVDGKTYEFVKNPADATEGSVAVVIGSSDTETAKNFAAAMNSNGVDAKYDSSTGKISIKNDVEAAKEMVSGGLTLQIGDTAEEWNQMTVSIGNMHVDALGIGDLDISSIEGAQAAVDKITEAINTVSSTRGDLGAIQNRLEHTTNNLAVMKENITDAESSIRDTDVADEMMKYTKNNILIQSAQAMLAQANAVPQGVLQLLQ